VTCPPEVLRLVDRFERELDAYRSGKYNETQVRREFIDPLFTALGWDIDNHGGGAVAQRDVVHEDAIKVGGVTRAPDYGFRVRGIHKFFLEAKKPSVNIKDDLAPAFQLRRYAWNAKLPLSILTDFEEFAVYDCRTKPAVEDKPSTGRLLYLTFADYVGRWEEIASIFSRDAVLQGSFDQFAESSKSKRGTAEVDAAFLSDIEAWRLLLARNLALRNPGLSQRELNFAVQQTIDRLIFLRICEDRGIEEYGRLRDALKGPGVYSRLVTLFVRADQRYNSGLFHFEREKARPGLPDVLTPSLAVDDRILRDIIGTLYYPVSPYEFAVLPADILGQVYEQFLGKVIRLTPGHRAEVEDKPEVKKAGGVYYTPTYIVEYIVRQTVGKLLEGKTPKEAAALRILDPACGSGSFLIEAYQLLLDWHCDWYVRDGLQRHSKQLYEHGEGDYRLTSAERKRILLNNIYGVDIDPQAVEVTKLSLLLKVLEGESHETLQVQLQMFQERALPDLDANIKCGNSLIGPEFYDQQALNLFTDEELYRINVLDWHRTFPAVFDDPAAGFSAVIGNPPYIRIHNLVDHYPAETKFIQTAYESALFGKVDIYVAFVERGLQLLNSSHGVLGYILPNKFLQADYGVGLRRVISRDRVLAQLVDFGHMQVFRSATIYTCLLFLEKGGRESFRLRQNTRGLPPEALLGREDADSTELACTLTQQPWDLAPEAERAVLDKAWRVGRPLYDLMESVITGVKTGANDAFILVPGEVGDAAISARALGSSVPRFFERDILKPFTKADGLKRYVCGEGEELLLLYPYRIVNGKTELIPETVMRAEYPLAWAYLQENRSALARRQKGRLPEHAWYGLSFSSSMAMFEVPKLVTPTLSTCNSFSFDVTGRYFPQGAGGGCGMVVKHSYDEAAVLALLNSRLLTFVFQRISSRFQGGWFAYEPRYLKRLPVFVADGDLTGEQRWARLAELGREILLLKTKVREARLPQDRANAERLFHVADRQIDELVYEVYGLSGSEILVVEDATCR
jgi:hypothetical protein